MAGLSKKTREKPRESLLIKVKGPRKFILGTELEARKEGALHGWDYESVLAANALARLAFSDINEHMTAIAVARKAFRTDLKSIDLDDMVSGGGKAKSLSEDEKAWFGMSEWFYVVHAFKNSIGDALASAVQAEQHSRSEQGKLIKKRLSDAVNFLLATINVKKKPVPHGNVLLVKKRGNGATFVPLVFATIEVFLECACRLARYPSKAELKEELARQYGDKTFQKKSTGSGAEQMLLGPKISSLSSRTWTKILGMAGLKLIDQSKKGSRLPRK